jgi:hypothetical protein
MDIAETRAFVRKAHDGQRDKIGRPYVEHVERVADRVAVKLGALRERGVTIEPAQAQEIVTAALLHDVIEDCGLVADDLLNLGCPDAVVDTVLTLTRRKGEAYPEFIERIAALGNLGGAEHADRRSLNLGARRHCAESSIRQHPNRPLHRQRRALAQRRFRATAKSIDSALTVAASNTAIAEAELAKAFGYELCKCDFPPTPMKTVGYHTIQTTYIHTGDPVYECPKCGYNSAGPIMYHRLAPERKPPESS